LGAAPNRNDPWLSFDGARAWATCWDLGLIDAGEVGHINPAAGFGPWPMAARWVERQLQRWHAERQLERAHPFEMSWAV
jgi:predicted alpha/beta hydrolase family esterase